MTFRWHQHSPAVSERDSHTLPSPVTGQVVRIEHSGRVLRDYLQINEVQVFNQAVEEVNLAREATATAALSSTYTTYYAQRAIDGVVAGVAGAGATGINAHIRVAPKTRCSRCGRWIWARCSPSAPIRVFTAADTTANAERRSRRGGPG